ncbi:hypothetical protein F4780DRAFT_618019 [Xylariomycetidae sp. FL0641]|nr:hypothetical protein F4780DRAFT_618019 [Xylariomycetidae sp. FL0641]
MFIVSQLPACLLATCLANLPCGLWAVLIPRNCLLRSSSTDTVTALRDPKDVLGTHQCSCPVKLDLFIRFISHASRSRARKTVVPSFFFFSPQVICHPRCGKRAGCPGRPRRPSFGCDRRPKLITYLPDLTVPPGSTDDKPDRFKARQAFVDAFLRLADKPTETQQEDNEEKT